VRARADREVQVKRLSERQEIMLRFISEYTEDHGYPPSIREIGKAAGISSTSVVDYNLRVLERQGHLRRDREVSRGLGLAEEHGGRTRVVRVPLVGRIAAGEPIEAIDGDHELLEFPASLVSGDCYALRVKGRSMIEDCIADGDVVLVRPQETAENGQIVVALIDDETSSGGATLKRIYREKGRIRLQPANSEMDPIYVAPEACRVRGRVVGLFRQI
jgi:repressor LexA